MIPRAWICPRCNHINHRAKTHCQECGQPKPAPDAQLREHITDGSPCWCHPDVDYIDPETGAKVIVHKEVQ